MKRYTAAQARQHLAALLDAAERGESVVIERRGVRFGLRAASSAGKRRVRPRPIFAHLDAAVLAGQWTWELQREALEFVPRPPAR